MPTDFNDLAYFGITNVQMNEKCWNRGVTFSLRTIFHFEQCDKWDLSIISVQIFKLSVGKGEKVLKSSTVGDLTSNTLSASELTERAAKRAATTA